MKFFQSAEETGKPTNIIGVKVTDSLADQTNSLGNTTPNGA